MNSKILKNFYKSMLLASSLAAPYAMETNHPFDMNANSQTPNNVQPQSINLQESAKELSETKAEIALLVRKVNAKTKIFENTRQSFGDGNHYLGNPPKEVEEYLANPFKEIEDLEKIVILYKKRSELEVENGLRVSALVQAREYQKKLIELLKELPDQYLIVKEENLKIHEKIILYYDQEIQESSTIEEKKRILRSAINNINSVMELESDPNKKIKNYEKLSSYYEQFIANDQGAIDQGFILNVAKNYMILGELYIDPVRKLEVYEKAVLLHNEVLQLIEKQLFKNPLQVSQFHLVSKVETLTEFGSVMQAIGDTHTDPSKKLHFYKESLSIYKKVLGILLNGEHNHIAWINDHPAYEGGGAPKLLQTSYTTKDVKAKFLAVMVAIQKLESEATLKQ